MRTMTAPHDGVRAYRSADAAACCAVINRAVEEMDGLNDAARRLIPTRNTPSVLDAELVNLYTIVCEVDGVCVGLGVLHDAEIKRVYVDPDAQGSGVGDAIMSALEAEAIRRGLVRVRLEASPSSVSFYERRGYAPSVEERMAVGDAAFHFIPMTLELSTRPS
jgi:GNAT superfamily N-acetyltransferase